MWIRLDCPNGHPVKVDEKFAGRMGRCPACGAKVRIPDVAHGDMSEDAILDILGPTAEPVVAKAVGAIPGAAPTAVKQPAATTSAASEDDIHTAHAANSGAGSAIGSTVGMSPASSAGGGSGSGSGSSALGQQTRVCPSCKRKVSVRYQICPHCRMYMPITGVGAGSTILRGHATITNCTHCGVRSFPGATVCNNCGEPLT